MHVNISLFLVDLILHLEQGMEPDLMLRVDQRFVKNTRYDKIFYPLRLFLLQRGCQELSNHLGNQVTFSPKPGNNQFQSAHQLLFVNNDWIIQRRCMHFFHRWIWHLEEDIPVFGFCCHKIPDQSGHHV